MQALLFFVRLIPPALLRRLLRWHFDSVSQLSPVALAFDMTMAPVLLLDLRTQAEYESGHIAGAIRVADSTTAQWLIEAFRADTAAPRVVAYCTVGYRSSQFALHMASIGAAQVENLEGGIWAWDSAGEPVVSEPVVRATSS